MHTSTMAGKKHAQCIGYVRRGRRWTVVTVGDDDEPRTLRGMLIIADSRSNRIGPSLRIQNWSGAALVAGTETRDEGVASPDNGISADQRSLPALGGAEGDQGLAVNSLRSPQTHSNRLATKSAP